MLVNMEAPITIWNKPTKYHGGGRCVILGHCTTLPKDPAKDHAHAEFVMWLGRACAARPGAWLASCGNSCTFPSL